MTKLVRLARFVIAALVCYIVFGVAGEWSAIGILYLTSLNDAVGWLMYGAGIIGAVAVPIGVSVQLRRGRRFDPFIRGCLAGFTAFFFSQWVVGGTPDFNPLPIVVGFAVCAASAVAVLRLTRTPPACEVEQPNRSVEPSTSGSAS